MRQNNKIIKYIYIYIYLFYIKIKNLFLNFKINKQKDMKI